MVQYFIFNRAVLFILVINVASYAKLYEHALWLDSEMVSEFLMGVIHLRESVTLFMIHVVLILSAEMHVSGIRYLDFS